MTATAWISTSMQVRILSEKFAAMIQRRAYGLRDKDYLSLCTRQVTASPLAALPIARVFVQGTASRASHEAPARAGGRSHRLLI
jgi:hypothetical protein